MSRLRSLLARNAMAKIVGMGNLPRSTSRLAAIKPKVAAGKMSKAKADPKTGIMDNKDTQAMNRKNKPVKAKGWRQKVRMPCLTQDRPCLAGTIWRFMR